MKDKQINELFIRLIKDKVKDEKKVATVLSDILNIQKEAVYRRLRNEVTFTFAEIIDICYVLSISLDHIIGLDKQYYPFHLQGIAYKELTKDRISKQKKDVLNLNHIIVEDMCEYAEVTSSIPVIFFFSFEYLLKWYLYIWDYHRYYQPSKSIKKFHEFEYAPKILEISRLLVSRLKNITNSYIIFDRKFLEYFAANIKTITALGYISPEDVSKIKEELIRFLNYLEKVAISGIYPETGKNVSIYISDFKVHSEFAYIKSNDYHVSMVKLFSFNSIQSINEEPYIEIQNWFKSYERLATLISVSGENGRNVFFREQREIIEPL